MVDHEFPFDLLHVLGDVGVDVAPTSVVEARVRLMVESEMQRPSRRPRRRSRMRHRGRRLGWIGPALSSAVAIVVALGVVVLLAHPHDAAGQRSVASGSLRSRFAVLRRAQSAADQLPRSVLEAVTKRDGGRVLTGSSRLLLRRTNARVFLVVLAPADNGSALTSSGAWGARLGDQLVLVERIDGRSVISPAVPGQVLNRAVDLTFITVAYPSSGRSGSVDHQLFLAPDGVARVQLAEVAADGRVLGSRSAPVNHNTAEIAGPIVDLRRTGSSRIQLLHAKRRITWHAANMTVIPTSNTAERAAIARNRAAIAHSRAVIPGSQAEHRHLVAAAQSVHYQAPISLLDHFAIFSRADRPPLRLASGLVISRPTIQSLPDLLLHLNSTSSLDYAQARKVTNRYGVTMWIVPGRTGICVTVTLPHTTRSFGDCSGSQTLAERGGAGISSGTSQYGIVSTASNTVQLRTGRHSHRTIHPDDGIYINTPNSP